MDLRQPAAYRGFALNSVTVGPAGKLNGCQLQAVDFSSVGAVGYTEKRALADGRDASDVFLDGRVISMRGVLHGSTLPVLHDALQTLRAALTPTGAYADDPEGKGYVPFSFKAPTTRVGEFPSGFRDLYINCRPRTPPGFVVDRDRFGGADELGGSMLWESVLEAIDPRIYVDPAVVEVLGVGAGAVGSGDLINRGDYPAPLFVVVAVPSTSGLGTLTLNVGGSQMQLTLPNSAVAQVLTYDGAKKILVLEENGIQTLRMDLLAFLAGTTHPLVPPGGGPYDWSSTQNITRDDSYLTYSEAFA